MKLPGTFPGLRPPFANASAWTGQGGRDEHARPAEEPAPAFEAVLSSRETDDAGLPADTPPGPFAPAPPVATPRRGDGSLHLFGMGSGESTPSVAADAARDLIAPASDEPTLAAMIASAAAPQQAPPAPESTPPFEVVAASAWDGTAESDPPVATKPPLVKSSPAADEAPRAKDEPARKHGSEDALAIPSANPLAAYAPPPAIVTASAAPVVAGEAPSPREVRSGLAPLGRTSEAGIVLGPRLADDGSARPATPSPRRDAIGDTAAPVAAAGHRSGSPGDAAHTGGGNAFGRDRASAGKIDTLVVKQPAPADGGATPRDDDTASSRASLALAPTDATAPVAQPATMSPAAMPQLPPVQQIVQAIASAATSAVAAAAAPQASAATIQPATRALDIELQPPDLGLVSVRMRLSGTRLDLHIEVSRKDTLPLVDKDDGALASSLQSSGYTIDRLTIKAADPHAANPQQQTPSQGSDQRPSPQPQGHSGQSSGARDRGSQDSGARSGGHSRQNQPTAIGASRAGGGDHLGPARRVGGDLYV